MTSFDIKEAYKTKELAEILKVSRSTVSKWCNKGILDAALGLNTGYKIRTEFGLTIGYRIRKEAVIKFLMYNHARFKRNVAQKPKWKPEWEGVLEWLKSK